MVKGAAKKSVEDFWTLVRPKISAMMGPSYKFTPVEASAQRGSPDVFDIEAGVDVWVKDTRGAGLIYGLANRVQWCAKPFDTFTVRYKLPSGGMTEYQKRLESIEKESVYPRFTVQSYVSADRKDLYSCAVVLTRDLILYLKDALAKMRERHQEIVDVTGSELPFHCVKINQMAVYANDRDGVQFCAVEWGKLKEAGVHLKVWQNPILSPSKTSDKAEIKRIEALRGVRPTLSMNQFAAAK